MGWDFVIYERLGKYSVMTAVSTIISFVIKGDGRLGWDFVIDGRLGKD